jgi:hypothetical protein
MLAFVWWRQEGAMDADAIAGAGEWHRKMRPGQPY